MAQAGDGEYQVIKNANPIAKRVKVLNGASVDQMLDRAQEAVLNLSDDFKRIYKQDIERIDMHFSMAQEDPETKDEEIAAIRRYLHDLRGQAGTFGFQLVGNISDSACKYIDLSETIGDTEMDVINMHIDALKAVSRASMAGDGGSIGIELMEGLRAVIRKFAGDLDS